jgi:nucleoside-diphosphate-sugar epimerase
MKRVLITGASGFIGRSLSNELLNQGYIVAALLRKKSNLLPVDVNQIIICDFNNIIDYSLIFKDIDCLIHLAGRAHIIDKGVKFNLDKFREVNTCLTLNLAKKAAEFGVNRFLFLSSIGVNGNQNNKPFSEIDIPNPQDSYAISKYEAEKGLFRISKDTQLRIVVIRPPLVYGANAPGNFGRLIDFFSTKFLLPLPFGAVNNKRSLVAIDNLVDFIITCMVHKNAENEVFLISDNQDVSTMQLLNKMAKAFDRKLVLLPIPIKFMILLARLIGKRKDAIRLFSSLQIDISKAQKNLNWQPKVTIDEQLSKIP